MRLIRYFFGFTSLVLLCTGVSCTQSTTSYEEADGRISGSGVLISEARELGYFNVVHSSGPVTTVISQGDTREILVTADDNVMQRVNTSIHGNTLYISLDEGLYHNIWIRVRIVVPAISAVGNSGSGSMKVSNLDIEGALKARNSGTGLLILEGRANEVSLVNEGTGTVNGFGFETSRCTIYNIGAGDCGIHCTMLLDGSNTGGGTISYTGEATVTIENTGTGRLIKQL
jgi:hypothetical protein